MPMRNDLHLILITSCHAARAIRQANAALLTFLYLAISHAVIYNDFKIPIENARRNESLLIPNNKPKFIQPTNYVHDT